MTYDVKIKSGEIVINGKVYGHILGSRGEGFYIESVDGKKSFGKKEIRDFFIHPTTGKKAYATFWGSWGYFSDAAKWARRNPEEIVEKF